MTCKERVVVGFSEDDIRQVIGGIAGFRAYYLLKTGEGTTSIRSSRTRRAPRESNRAAAAWLAENLPDLDLAAPQVTAGETVLDF